MTFIFLALSLQGAATPSVAVGDPAAIAIEAVDLGPIFRGAHPRVLGMDGAYSLPLGQGKSLWIFGDTLLGSWTSDGQRRIDGMPANTGAIVADREWPLGFPGAKFVRESAVLMESGSDKRRRWPLDLIRTPAGPAMFYVEIAPHGTGPLDFSVVGSGLVRLGRDFSGDRGIGLWPGDSPTFGTSAMEWKGNMYLYAGGAKTYLARNTMSRLAEPGGYAYWSEGGWRSKWQDAARLPESGPEMTVRFNAYLGAFVMVYIPPFGRDVMLRLAPEPWGPWSEPRKVASCQPLADPSASCYGAKQHVELDADLGRHVVITYNTNTTSEALKLRIDLYWPRLVRIAFRRFAPRP